MDYRSELDSIGEVKVPTDKYWAAQTGAAGGTSHRRGHRDHAPEITHAFGMLKEGCGHGEPGPKPEKLTDELKGHFSGLRRSHGRQSERAFSAGGVADGLRHPEQHER